MSLEKKEKSFNFGLICLIENKTSTTSKDFPKGIEEEKGTF